jgi:hypothetical protein
LDDGVIITFTPGVVWRQICALPMSETPPETREELVQHLEKVTGRTLKTRADIRAYVREVAERKAADQPSVRRWLNAKRITLVALLAFGVLQYYILDVMLEIASLPSTTFFVPASTSTQKSMADTTG